MKKWLPLILGISLILSVISGCGKDKSTPEVPPKAGMEKVTTVGGTTFDLPANVFMPEAIEKESEDGMKLELQMFEIPKDDSTFLLAMKLEPPFWLVPIFWFSDWNTDCVKDGFTDAYQKNFANAYLKEVGTGKQGISWGKSQVLDYNGHAVLKMQGEILTLKTRQKSIHEHYSWIVGSDVYVIIAYYDQKDKAKMQPIITQVLNTIHFK